MVSDAGTADFQNIRLREQRGSFDGLAHRGAEASAVVQGNILTIAATDLDLQRHRLKVGQYLDADHLKTMAFGGGRCQGR